MIVSSIYQLPDPSCCSGQFIWLRARRCKMAKYLSQAKLTEKGLQALLKEGGSKRREAIEKAVKSLGGKLEAFYYVFGDYDVVGIVDLPDNVAATAASLLITAGGATTVRTTVLITPEEVDQATKKTIDYQAPGQ
jgi:uncharacterized protein with GYD domain